MRSRGAVCEHVLGLWLGQQAGFAHILFFMPRQIKDVLNVV